MSEQSDPQERSPIGEAFLPLLDRCPPAEHRVLLAALERLAADHYRGWSGMTEDAETRRGLLECAEREERIAATLESLEPDAERIIKLIHERFPDLSTRYASVMEGRSLTEQWTTQAIGELGGADLLRTFAEQEPDSATRETLVSLTTLEEANSAFMRRAATAARG